MNIDVDTIIELAREKLPAELAADFISDLNARLKEIQQEEQAEEDSEPKEKTEYNYYLIYDKNVEDEGTKAPRFGIKVPLEVSPMDIELFVQSAITNKKSGAGGKKRRGKKAKTIANLWDVANSLRKKDWDENKEVKFTAKEPYVELPIGILF